MTTEIPGEIDSRRVQMHILQNQWFMIAALVCIMQLLFPCYRTRKHISPSKLRKRMMGRMNRVKGVLRQYGEEVEHEVQMDEKDYEANGLVHGADE